MSVETQDIGHGGVQQMAKFVKSDSVENPSAEYKFWLDNTHLERTLLGGARAMRNAKDTYLPKYLAEQQLNYEARIKMSSLLNAYTKTASFLSGQIFQSDIILDDSVPDELVDLMGNIDLKNNNINVFLKRVFFNGISKGVSHILVDAPVSGPDIITRKDEIDSGIRPFLREIRPEDIIGWRVDDKGELTQLRIKESRIEDLGTYSTKTVNFIKVLRPGAWELWRQGESGEFVLFDEGIISLDFIPLVSFIPGEELSVVTGIPPLSDLAELNLRHWQSNSDQINILHVARIPFLFGKNIDLDNFVAGVSAMITSDDDDSDIKYIEITGKAVESGSKDLKEVESQMSLYGLQQLVPRSGNMTATEKTLTSAESNSSLGTWATEFQANISQAIGIMAEYMGIDLDMDIVTVNKEYNYGVADPQELMFLLESKKFGVLSPQACFTEVRRRGIFDEHLSWDDIEADIEEDLRAGDSFQGTLFNE